MAADQLTACQFQSEFPDQFRQSTNCLAAVESTALIQLAATRDRDPIVCNRDQTGIFTIEQIEPSR